MIITQTVKIKICAPNISYYRSLGYDVSISDIINISVLELKKSSNIKIRYSCDSCFTENEGSYNFYNRCIKNSGKYLCIRCSYKEKMMNKYGVDHYSKTDNFKE